jgi:type IV pilus assembly protein PilW
MYSAYRSQLKTYMIQKQTAEMQQNIRAGLDIMVREIRMAGYDPLGTADAGILTASANSIEFTMDIGGGDSDGIDNDGDGLADENTKNQEKDGLDNDDDTLVDEFDEADEFRYSDGECDDANEHIRYAINTSGNLGRATGTGNLMPAAYNIDALNFVYLDEDGNPLDDGGGNVTNSISMIRSVEITILARSGKNVLALATDQIDSKVYHNPQGTAIFGPANDGFRRILVSTKVKFRNLNP